MKKHVVVGMFVAVLLAGCGKHEENTNAAGTTPA